jgi:IS1 family transposase
VANVLPKATRNSIIHLLCEGNSIRAVERITGVAKSTILRLALAVGEGCERLHNVLVRGIRAAYVECDEQWSFIVKKAKRCTEEDPAEWGDVWTYVGIDRDTKLCISYHCGKRDQAHTNAFMADLRVRLLVAPQLSTDGLINYVSAVGAEFGGAVDYGQCVKQYGYSRSPDHKYEPARDAQFIKKTTIIGAPAMGSIGTSIVERFNLSTRHTVGRTRRLCLAFSKTLAGHKAATALGFAAYNLVRIHSTIRCTPAMEAGLTDHVWEIGELVDAALAAPVADKPVKHDLTPREGTGPVRALPGGKGFLRLVTSDAPAPKGPKPAAPPPVSPVAPVAPAAPVEPAQAAAEPSGQLDLLSWRPKPREPQQLNLFGERDD